MSRAAAGEAQGAPAAASVWRAIDPPQRSSTMAQLVVLADAD
jgi:hypothetical protein